VDELEGGNPVEDELLMADPEELEPVELDCGDVPLEDDPELVDSFVVELDVEGWVLFELDETCLDDVELVTTELPEEDAELVDPVCVPVEFVDFVIEFEDIARELLLDETLCELEEDGPDPHTDPVLVTTGGLGATVGYGTFAVELIFIQTEFESTYIQKEVHGYLP
jgi:hypothetical protein